MAHRANLNFIADGCHERDQFSAKPVCAPVAMTVDETRSAKPMTAPVAPPSPPTQAPLQQQTQK